MKAGFSKKVITPTQHACELSGYAAKRPKKGVHDDLYAKILMIEVFGEIYGIVVCDLIAVDHLIVDRVHEFCETLGISQENIQVAATHTHSGPGGVLDTEHGYLKSTVDFMGRIDQPYIDEIVEQIKAGIREALENMSEAAVKIGHGTCRAVGKNRNSLEFSGNEDVLAMEFTNRQGKLAVVHYACHPTVLNKDNVLISADYPGALQNELEKAGYDMTLFLNGSCGDISTRFTRQGNGFEEVQRCGKLLSTAVLEALQKAVPYEIQSIESKRLQVTLRAKPIMPMELAHQEYEHAKMQHQTGLQEGVTGAKLRLLESAVEAAEANIRYIQNYEGQTSYEFAIPIVKINDDFYINIPGELFSQLSNPLQDERTHFIGYANGYLMYFADEYAYDRRVYEALSSPFEKGESEKMMSRIAEAIGK